MQFKFLKCKFFRPILANWTGNVTNFRLAKLTGINFPTLYLGKIDFCRVNNQSGNVLIKTIECSCAENDHKLQQMSCRACGHQRARFAVRTPPSGGRRWRGKRFLPDWKLLEFVLEGSISTGRRFRMVVAPFQYCSCCCCCCWNLERKDFVFVAVGVVCCVWFTFITRPPTAPPPQKQIRENRAKHTNW